VDFLAGTVAVILVMVIMVRVFCFDIVFLFSLPVFP
jgi:hypothetical protein